MKTVALLYRDHTDPFAGGAVHGYHVVEQLRRLGYHLITPEAKTDSRLTRYPRTPAGVRDLLRDADALYVRCDARPFDLGLLALNRKSTRKPVLTEINSIAEERLAYGRSPLNLARLYTQRAYYRRIVSLSDAAVCVSNQLAEFVRETYPIEGGRVFVAPNGGTAGTPARPDRGGDFRVVWAGGARWPWQALDLVIESVRLLRLRRPDAKLFVYTEDAAGRIPREPGIEVRAPVPHGELARELSSMHAALCLYRPMPWSPAGFYNSPLKLFDYLAAGLPVVGSRLGQIAEVIEHEKSGFLVGDDAREVAGALERLAADAALAERVGRAGYERLCTAYTWDHTGDRIGSVLGDLFARDLTRPSRTSSSERSSP